MEGYSSGHIRNDYNIAPQSKIDINLCFRGPRPREGNCNSLGDLNYSDVQPIGAPLWLQPGPWLNQCSSLTPVSLIEDDDMPDAVQRLLRKHEQNIICGEMESEMPMQDALDLERQPTFSFEPPGATLANQPRRNDSMASVEIKAEPDSEQLMPSQPLRLSRTRRGPKTEYSDATMKDFQQHLGVIDLRNELHSWPYQSSHVNVADVQYRRQLMLLEQQNVARLQSWRAQQRQ